MKLTKDNWKLFCEECGDCILWKQGTTGQGHPIARVDGKTSNVRRMVYEWTHGKVAKHLRVTNVCGRSRCLVHLKARTPGECLKLAYATGKRGGAQEYAARLAANVKLGRTKLNWDKVDQIRAIQGVPLKDLAATYQVHLSTIKDIRSYKTWISPGSSVFTWRKAA